jgi:outer membrane immunogenic protein
VADYRAVNLGDDVTAFSSTPASHTFTRDANSLTSLRARGGWASRAGLLYATAGMAWGDTDQSFTTTSTLNAFTPSQDREIDGHKIGLGCEVKLGEVWLVEAGWSMGLEYICTELDDGDDPVAVGGRTAPSTNPFLIVDPTGTDMKRTLDLFAYSTVGITLNWQPQPDSKTAPWGRRYPSVAWS